ncbi:MAG: glutamine amidotransferase [Nocardioides sp.]|nr:glutamine amidotransferase [Nocardioides sp.]
MRTVHLAVYPTWADWEPGFLVSRVNNPAWQRRPGSLRVRTVASSLEPVLSMGGVRVLPDLTFDELSPADSAMLVLPGGDLWDADQHPATSEPLRAASAFLEAGVPVAAICGATAGLARAGLLDDRAHTSSAPEYLLQSGGAYAGGHLYRHEDSVTDRGLITAGPTHPVEFARAALEQLEVFEPEALDAWYRLFGRQDPSGFAVLAGA